MLPPPLTPRLMLTPTTATPTPPCTTPTPTGPACPPPSAPPPVSAAAARGPPTLMPMLTMVCTDMVSPTTDTAVTTDSPVSPATPDPPLALLPDLPRELARGPLTLMPMLRPTTATTDTDTTVPTDTDTPELTDTVMDIPDTDTDGNQPEIKIVTYMLILFYQKR